MNYIFFTINTVVDIGSGEKQQNEFEVSPQSNLKRLLEYTSRFSYPMMVTVNKKFVDLNKEENSSFYSLPSTWGECYVYTLKFSISSLNDVDLNFDGVPLVQACTVNGIRISKIDKSNLSINKDSFTE